MEDIKALEQKVAELEKKVTKYEKFFANLDSLLKKLSVTILSWMKTLIIMMDVIWAFIGIPKNWVMKYVLAGMKISF